MAPTKENKEGYSGFTKETLPEALSQMEEDEEPTKAELSEYAMLEKQIEDQMKLVFKDLQILTDGTAKKWYEVIEKSFAKFEYSKIMLTTKDYKRANFAKCKIGWGLHDFKGQRDIKHALNLVDRSLTDHLEDNN